MKIDRRSFLAMSVGGAVGTALTPLPWKIQDDLAIWTQMWPWTPIPARWRKHLRQFGQHALWGRLWDHRAQGRGTGR